MHQGARMTILRHAGVKILDLELNGSPIERRIHTCSGIQSVEPEITPRAYSTGHAGFKINVI